jgi:hypothetical protein
MPWLTAHRTEHQPSRSAPFRNTYNPLPVSPAHAVQIVDGNTSPTTGCRLVVDEDWQIGGQWQPGGFGARCQACADAVQATQP